MSITVLAPAKVNLFLGIGPRREDGYHDAVSVMQALMLHDTLSFTMIPTGAYVKGLMYDDGTLAFETIEEGGLSVGIETLWREGMEECEIPLEENLVTRAVFALARAFDFPMKGGLRISVEKHIPMQAGLGGGSADAAATLVGCAALWGINREDPRLDEVARSLGADVAFFLHGGCGVYGGRGDVLERTLAPRKDSVLLVIPEGGVSTAEAYRTFDQDPQEVTPELHAQVDAAAVAAEIPLFNNLAPAAEQLLPELSAVREWAAGADGVVDVLLSGSGSASFCVCKDPETALRLAVDARAKGWRTRVTNFTSLRASVLPQSNQTNLGATRV